LGQHLGKIGFRAAKRAGGVVDAPVSSGMICRERFSTQM